MRWTNWYPHPADNRYYVFEFSDSNLADAYGRGLKEAGIEFEREVSDTALDGGSAAGGGAAGGGPQPHRFGVHRQYFKEASKVNHLLHGQHRTPFIPHAGLRWGMLVGTAAVVALALLGWMRS